MNDKSSVVMIFLYFLAIIKFCCFLPLHSSSSPAHPMATAHFSSSSPSLILTSSSPPKANTCPSFLPPLYLISFHL